MREHLLNNIKRLTQTSSTEWMNLNTLQKLIGQEVIVSHTVVVLNCKLE